MMITAAGTLTPAKVFVIGAGVAGLQAIATRPASGRGRLGLRRAPGGQRASAKPRRQVRRDAAGDRRRRKTKGGYAKAMDEAFYRRQRELMTKVVAENDVVITTAAVPGKKAPILVTAEMVAAMAPGSVIVDLAAERGGNCELTKPGETVVERRDDPRPRPICPPTCRTTPARCSPRTSRRSCRISSADGQFVVRPQRRDHPRDAGDATASEVVNAKVAKHRLGRAIVGV